MHHRFVLILLLIFPAIAQTVKPVPPPGVEIPAADRKSLEAGLARLNSKIAKLPPSPLVADVRIFSNAVYFALAYNGFMKDDEVLKARELLFLGEQRADSLAKGEAPWTRQTGLVVRGYESKIDGSVQPYAIRPAENSSNLELDTPGVVVTLHDAGGSCEEHVTRYMPKSWAHVLAPQGRRPYGFDWEAWGRIDVIEALADAGTHYPCDPLRTCLTGHGMGGHGVWHLGVTFPDKFAAIGPSAGWISFWSYGGGMASFENNPSAVETMMMHVQAEPVPPSRRSEQVIPEALERAVLACLEKDPDRRPASADALDAQLAAIPLDAPWTAARARGWWRAHCPPHLRERPSVRRCLDEAGGR